MSEPAFHRRVLEARQRVLEQAVTLLTASTSEAARTLLRLLRSSQDSVALAAARSILEQSVRLRDAAELEQRVIALEQAEAADTVAGLVFGDRDAM